ncbi:hypothetical protein, partial [Clavibacter michiganensis]|uniref:hypothetical protein n=1 Tax=Clavibacter michiganensis TaxID=28447 RepID=UPI00292F04A1
MGAVTVKVGADSFEVALDAAGPGRGGVPADAKGRDNVGAAHAGGAATAAEGRPPHVLYVGRLSGGRCGP